MSDLPELISPHKAIFFREAYWQIQEDTPFAKKVNKRLRDAWEKEVGEYRIDRVVIEVLIEDYNKRHKLSKPKKGRP